MENTERLKRSERLDNYLESSSNPLFAFPTHVTVSEHDNQETARLVEEQRGRSREVGDVIETHEPHGASCKKH